MIYPYITSAKCDMLADETTIHTSGQDVPSIIVILQPCVADIVDRMHLSHLFVNPLKNKIHDTYYMAEVSIDTHISCSHFD